MSKEIDLNQDQIKRQIADRMTAPIETKSELLKVVEAIAKEENKDKVSPEVQALINSKTNK